MSVIPIIVPDNLNHEGEEDQQEETLGFFSGTHKLKYVDTETIQESLTNLSGQISEVLQKIKSVGDFKLKEVQLSVEINAEGGVALIGSAKAGVKGAILLTFSTG